MATKKTTTKKTPTKKSAVAKKPAAKAKPVKKSKATKTGLRAHVGLRPEESAFFTFRLTRQTLYWLVLGAGVVLFPVWIMQLQADIQSLYDEIDAATMESAQL